MNSSLEILSALFLIGVAGITFVWAVYLLFYEFFYYTRKFEKNINRPSLNSFSVFFRIFRGRIISFYKSINIKLRIKLFKNALKKKDFFTAFLLITFISYLKYDNEKVHIKINWFNILTLMLTAVLYIANLMIHLYEAFKETNDDFCLNTDYQFSSRLTSLDKLGAKK